MAFPNELASGKHRLVQSVSLQEASEYCLEIHLNALSLPISL